MCNNGGINLNLNFGNNGIGGLPGQFGCQPKPPCKKKGGPFARIKQKLQQMLSRLTGGCKGQQNHACCPNNRPNFGCGNGFNGAQGGINIHMGASLQGFLG